MYGTYDKAPHMIDPSKISEFFRKNTARSPVGQPFKDDPHRAEYPAHINELYEKCMKKGAKQTITASDVSRFITSPFSIRADA